MRNLTRFIGIAVIAVAGLNVQLVHAEDNSRATAILEQRFKAANKTNDGKLTLEQAKAGMPRVAKNFDKIDVDHKGYVTLDQIKEGMESSHK